LKPAGTGSTGFSLDVPFREGDTFIVTKLDRLARSVGDLLNIVALLETKKVSLRVLSMSGSQPLDTATATGRLMLAVIGAVGQAERETMLERQREGIANAQREEKYKGRMPTVWRRAAEIIRLKDAGSDAHRDRQPIGDWSSLGVQGAGEP
jgi:DNA invertase Pin-like site-specific DNA recombinase